jgi:hypothetical protein
VQIEAEGVVTAALEGEVEVPEATKIEEVLPVVGMVETAGEAEGGVEEGFLPENKEGMSVSVIYLNEV